MAEHYISDDEQVEAIKQWWRTNGAGIITGIVIGLGVVFGWQYWRGYQIEQAEQASLHYDVLTQAIATDNADKAGQQAELLLEDFSSSIYATLGALMAAKLALEKSDNAAAIKYLEWVLANGRQDDLKDIARLRLARVLLAEDQLEEAEAQLEQIKNRSFTAEIEELKGDIYLAREQPAKARAAYEAARAAAGDRLGGSLLQLKLDNLPPAEA